MPLFLFMMLGVVGRLRDGVLAIVIEVPKDKASAHQHAHRLREQPPQAKIAHLLASTAYLGCAPPR